MRRFRRATRLILISGGCLFFLTGTCLPENYFALSARATAVVIADTVLGQALAPVFEALLSGGAGTTDASGM